MQTQQEANPYLQQEVMGASPVRLRWMLIRRAEELCGLVELLWAQGQDREAAGWLLRVRDILGELLSGVRDASNPLGKTVADLYVYLLKLLTETEQSKDPDRLLKLKELLAIEKETWHQVLQRDEAFSAKRPMMIPPVASVAPRTDPPKQPTIPSSAPKYFGSQNLQASSFSVDV